jgi:hypothetical protein
MGVGCCVTAARLAPSHLRPATAVGILRPVPARALDAVVSSFVDDVTAALLDAVRDLDRVEPERLRTDVTNEAYNLCAAMIDADDRHTVDELEALIDAFGHRLPDTTLLYATPADLQGSSLIVGRKRWLNEDSDLFGILSDADAHRGTHLAERYYERALDIAHVVASLDVVPSTTRANPRPTLKQSRPRTGPPTTRRPDRSRSCSPSWTS